MNTLENGSGRGGNRPRSGTSPDTIAVPLSWSVKLMGSDTPVYAMPALSLVRLTRNRMSAEGQKLPWRPRSLTSALPPKADSTRMARPACRYGPPQGYRSCAPLAANAGKRRVRLLGGVGEGREGQRILLGAYPPADNRARYNRAIVAGEQPSTLQLDDLLKPLPAAWSQQHPKLFRPQ